MLASERAAFIFFDRDSNPTCFFYKCRELNLSAVSSLGLKLRYKVDWGIESGLLSSAYYLQHKLLLSSRRFDGILKTRLCYTVLKISVPGPRKYRYPQDKLQLYS